MGKLLRRAQSLAGIWRMQVKCWDVMMIIPGSDPIGRSRVSSLKINQLTNTYLWSHYQYYLIDKIERVQKYFSRRVLFRTKLPYLTRLKVLKLEPLETRRIKFDLKLCYKIINGLCDLNFDEFFTFASSPVTRGYN